jgi:hypothetical protein
MTFTLEEVLSHVPYKVSCEMNEILNAPYTGKEIKKLCSKWPIQKHQGQMGILHISSKNIWHYVVKRLLK